LQALAYGTANVSDRERYGPYWLAALIDLAQRGGVGELERAEDGSVVFRPALEVPSAEEAWRRAIRRGKPPNRTPRVVRWRNADS
jgi:hypothetical protein